ncbi:MAG: CooT family nickel-binding protein [Desulfobulbaceae bacterium]|nr:CooT family nickel-binding protein [Desulfobulbaceae bacterium]
MCQMSVMLEKDDQADELIMENASLLEVKSEGVEISSLFDPPQLLSGVKVAKIDFMNGKVLLVKC